MRFLALAILLLLPISCGTTAGVREFQAYAVGFQELESASEDVLAKLGEAERNSDIALIDEDTVEGISGDLARENIPLFASKADPQFTGALRTAVQSVTLYNDALLRYASGSGLSGLSSDVGVFQSGDFGFEAPEGGGASLAELFGASQKVAILISGLESIGSREAFRTELRASGKEVIKLLDMLPNFSDTAFNALTRDDFADLRRAIRRGQTADADRLRQSISDDRTMLADWFYMIELSREQLELAMRAIDRPASANQRIVEAALVAGDFRARADSIKALAVKN